MNRRRFLKYAGGAAAIVGASAIGLDFLAYKPQPSQSSTSLTRSTSEAATSMGSTTQASSTSVSSSSSMSPGQAASLKGRMFFDYDGNGEQDGEEPAIPNAKIQLLNDRGQVVAGTLSDSSGDYRLDAPVGSYRLHLEVDSKFRYMCTSVEEFRAVSNGYDAALNEAGKISELDVGLMEGFLTGPFHKGKVSRIEGYVDIDPRPNHILDWKGGNQTYDGHRGTDFIADKGTEILAAAPGTIVYAWNSWPNKPVWGDQDDTWKNGNSVQIDHGNNFWSVYNHLDSITVSETYWSTHGQHVRRGQVIGYCGYTGFRPDLVTPMTPNQVHLHFEIDIPGPNFYKNGDRRGGQVTDPFRDLYYGQHGDSPLSDPVSLWTKDNDPQYAVT